jgi:hypothetical protein
LIKKLIPAVLASASLGASAGQQARFVVGKNEIVPPSGWQLITSAEDKLVFRSQDSRQQATVSVMRLASTTTFEDFRKICDRRYAAEKQAMNDGFIQPDNPDPIQRW